MAAWVHAMGAVRFASLAYREGIMGRVSRILQSPLSNTSHRDRAVPPIGTRPLDEDLPRLRAAWPHLPEHFKRTIMTMIEVTERYLPRPADTVPSTRTDGEPALLNQGERAIVT